MRNSIAQSSKSRFAVPKDLPRLARLARSRQCHDILEAIGPRRGLNLATDAKLSGDAKPGSDGKADLDAKAEGKSEPKISSSHITKAEWEALPNKTRILIHREHGHLMIDAKVNGQWGKFAFDTGATRCGIGIYDYPNMFTKAQLDSAKRIGINRPQGLVVGWDLVADVTVQDITRRVGFTVLPEKNVCVIGQNFFKEYNCQIDDFYIRLTKAPYQEENSSIASGQASGVPSGKPSSAASGVASDNIAPTGKLPKTSQTVAGGTAIGGIVSNSTRNSINNSMVISDLKNPPAKPAMDKYTISFERQQDTMLIDILVNGVPVKAIFDTGCAPDGIVCHPSFAGVAHMQPMSRHAERIQIGLYYSHGRTRILRRRIAIPASRAQNLQSPIHDRPGQ